MSAVVSQYFRYALYAGAGALLLWMLQARGGPRTGAAAPPFDLPLVLQEPREAARAKLEGRAKRPLLIEVFASWCGTCRRSAPALADAYRAYGSDLDFLGVSVDDTPEAALAAKQQWQIPYPVAHDDRGAFAQSYRVRVLPTFILLDAEGRIQEVSAGMPGAGRLREWAEAVTK